MPDKKEYYHSPTDVIGLMLYSAIIGIIMGFLVGMLVGTHVPNSPADNVCFEEFTYGK